ncbi:hypothetical protein L917_10073, partial [Phytophthora nicotianae]
APQVEDPPVSDTEGVSCEVEELSVVPELSVSVDEVLVDVISAPELPASVEMVLVAAEGCITLRPGS